MASWWREPLRDGTTPAWFLSEHWGQLSDREIADRLTDEVGRAVTREAVKKKRQSMGLYKPPTWRPGAGQPTTEPEQPQADEAAYLEEWRELPDDEKPTWREIVAHAAEGAQLQGRLRPIYNRATRVIHATEPVFVSFPADFHLGSPHTDYDAFLRTSDLLINDERFYLAVVGSDQECAFAWFRDASAVLGQTIPPFMQIEAFRQWIDAILPRLLALCADNHMDERLERVLGDIGVLWRRDVPYFRSYGLLELKVGETTYELLMKHRYKGHSIYHDLQPTLRMMRDIYPIADVYVTAHTHLPAYMNGVFYREARPLKPRQHFIVTGTFKTGDDLYATRNFGCSGVLGVPTLALWPDEYRVQYFDSPEAALEAMG